MDGLGDLMVPFLDSMALFLDSIASIECVVVALKLGLAVQAISVVAFGKILAALEIVVVTLELG